jgi:sugar phosphate isomerase/epimerase
MTGPKLSLDSLTLTDTEPQVAIRAAAEAGFDLCSLWVQEPALYPSPLLTADKERECAAILADTGMCVEALEVFDLHSREAVESYKPQLDLGARLGGKTALTINFTNPDRSETADVLALFAETAGQFGLAVNLEPVCGGQSQTLAEARDLILAAGADIGLCFDPHHLVRTGGGADDLKAIGPGWIRYVQVCDGPIPQPAEIAATEAISERLYPGEGDFPLLDLLRAAPRDVTVGFECPSLRRMEDGRSAQDQAREAMASLRKLLAEL